MVPASLLDRVVDIAQPVLWVEPDGQILTHPRKVDAILPGSFHPLHVGHVGLAKTAQQLFGLDFVFELCLRNVDKPPLSPAETVHRIRQFAWKYPVCLTTAPTFVEKARLFPRAVFLVGADTAERIIAARYYSGDDKGMVLALDEIRAQGCRFLVAGRRNAQGVLLQVHDLPISAQFLDLFQGIPAADFCLDISSTEIRNQQSLSHSHGRKIEGEAQS